MKHIRILSPSGVINPELILGAQKRLESWGYQVSIGQHAMRQYGRFAGTAAERLADINQALADPTVDIILCSRGGYGLQQILDQIQLPSRPKAEWPLIVGYSDITELHCLMALHGVRTLHMSMCKDLSELADNDPTLLAMRAALASETSHPTLQELAHNTPIIGGNLSVLYGLQGTTWDLNHIIDTMDSAPILLLEDIDEAHYHIDRMMNNLRLSGVLARISGLVVGYFTNCDEDKRMCCTIADTILQAVREYDYPVMLGAPIGHEQPNRPVMLGVEHTLIVNDEGATLTPCV
jgi:muramoyltetrapeptide carboxypeptidase